MAISNINAANQYTSVNRTTNPTTPHVARMERSQDDRPESTKVTLSTHARDLHRTENELAAAEERHIKRIEEFHRSDEMAHEKSSENAKVEARANEAKQKMDQEFAKRINATA